MKEQKGFLIAIIALVAIVVGLQVYTMVKNRKPKDQEVASDSPELRSRIGIGDLDQEIIED